MDTTGSPSQRIRLKPQLLPHLRFSSTEDHGDEDGPDQITPAGPVQGIGAHPPEPHEGPQGREQRIYDGLDDEGEQLGDEKIPDARGRLNRTGEVSELQVHERADGQKGVIAPSVLSPEFSDGSAAALILLRHNEPTGPPFGRDVAEPNGIVRIPETKPLGGGPSRG